MASLVIWLYALGGAYLMGSIPFGLLFAKQFHKGDVRQIGSKSIGATNVLRTGSKTAAALTLLCDTLKGYLPLAFFWFWGGEPKAYIFVALAAVLGHVFPFELRFKGGKGVATGLGTLLALHPLSAILALLVWGSVFMWKRISSLAAVSVCLILPCLTGLQAFWNPNLRSVWIYSLFLSPLLLFTHRANIGRLLRNEEKGFRTEKH